MWDNHRLLSGIAGGLYAVAGALLLYAVGVAIVRLPIFPIREMEVSGRIAHTTHNQMQQIVARELKGNFFTMDLEQTRAATPEDEEMNKIPRVIGSSDRGPSLDVALGANRS